MAGVMPISRESAAAMSHSQSPKTLQYLRGLGLVGLDRVSDEADSPLAGGVVASISGGVGGVVGDIILWEAGKAIARGVGGDDWGGGGGFGGGGGGFGGFSGGGGSFGGGGASGGW